MTLLLHRAMTFTNSKRYLKLIRYGVSNSYCVEINTHSPFERWVFNDSANQTISARQQLRGTTNGS